MRMTTLSNWSSGLARRNCCISRMPSFFSSSSAASHNSSPSLQKYSMPIHTVFWSFTRYGLQLLKTCSRPTLTPGSWT
ncbi:hypothetical protein D3C83_40990 [compost metagenome]